VAGVKNVHNHLAVVLPDDDYRDDPMLTTAANNALALNVTVPDGVEATALDGDVTLTGTVTYGREREAAVTRWPADRCPQRHRRDRDQLRRRSPRRRAVPRSTRAGSSPNRGP